jgi:Alginate export
MIGNALAIRRVSMRAALLLGLATAWAPWSAASEAPSWQDHVVFTASDRLRGELVKWFEPPEGAAPSSANEYAFLANQLRLGARVTFPHVQAVVEVQDTRLFNVPDDATLPAPFGNLGPGASYFAETRDRNQGETFLKQGYATIRRSGLALSAGRLEYSDGLETVPGDRTLAALKRLRIAERLIGPFGYTHVTRSFDAVRLAYDQPSWNATAFAAHPTRGGFEVSANRHLSDVSVAGLALTAKGFQDAPPLDLRAFYLYYEDGRDEPTKVDNRPLSLRALDGRSIRVHTAGAHALGVFELGPGALDALAWGALQTGEWGRQDHLAWAHALEVGYQLGGLFAAPWLRVGWNRSSGDSDSNDGDHETFTQLLPTARLYAQFPFYNLMNNEDWFAQILLQPHPLVAIRADYHWLRVTERRDLWYSGGGASDEELFGFSGIPAGGQHDLAQAVDVAVSLGPWRRLWLNAYYGHAFEGSVIRNTFEANDADYGYLELVFRY